jgi:hypothetical protein
MVSGKGFSMACIQRLNKFCLQDDGWLLSDDPNAAKRLGNDERQTHQNQKTGFH